LLEDRRCLDVSEGVEQREPALEHRLNLRVARGGKADLAELLRRSVRVIMLVLGERPPWHECQGGRQNKTAAEGPHGFFLCCGGPRSPARQGLAQPRRAPLRGCSARDHRRASPQPGAPAEAGELECAPNGGAHMKRMLALITCMASGCIYADVKTPLAY